jgi:hypothetical protein
LSVAVPEADPAAGGSSVRAKSATPSAWSAVLRPVI